MQFVYPSFLFALGAISIPIIIHLFNFRRYKKIIFSDIRFLKQIQEETRSRQKIKELLILLARILAISALVFAFAQPFIPHKETNLFAGQKAVSIYIDNSFSMANEGKDGALIETAKNKARSIINAYGNDEQFQIITNNFEGRQQRFFSKNEALKIIDDVQISASSKTLPAIVSRQKQAFENTAQSKQISYIISDFQKNNADLINLKTDSNFLLNFIPVQANSSHNLFIDSAWLISPIIRINTPIQLKIRVRNSSNDDAENIAIALKINSVQKALVNVNCSSQSFIDAELSFTLNTDGWQQGEISLLDHPITFDDKLFFTIKPSTLSHILCINGESENKYINNVFAGDVSYSLINSSQNQLNYNEFSQKHLIILNELSSVSSGLNAELKKYVEGGGFLFVIPSAQSTNNSLSSFLSDINSISLGSVVKQSLKVDHINLHENIFSDVFQKIPRNIDLPTVTQYYEVIKNSRSRGVTLLQLNNGSPLVYQSSYKKGRVFILSTPLNPEWSNLQQHSLFVPLMLKLALGDTYHAHLYYVIDKDKWINTDMDWQGAEKIARIWGNDIDMLSEVKQQDGKNEVYIDQQLQKSGIYQLCKKGQNSADALFAMNYKRNESYTSTFDATELAQNTTAEILNDDATVLQQKITQELDGTQLWRLFIVLAVIFILTEVLLLKWLK